MSALTPPLSEQQAAKGDFSQLHIIIFDEIDAICKQRGKGGDSSGVHDTVVNQMLSKVYINMHIPNRYIQYAVKAWAPCVCMLRWVRVTAPCCVLVQVCLGCTYYTLWL